jgi:NADPH:quinone reductase
MKIVEFDRFGPPDVLKVVDVPTPEPRPGAVLVRVKAAGVNFFEVLMRANLYAVKPILPMAPGVEVAGAGGDPAFCNGAHRWLRRVRGD